MSSAGSSLLRKVKRAYLPYWDSPLIKTIVTPFQRSIMHLSPWECQFLRQRCWKSIHPSLPWNLECTLSQVDSLPWQTFPCQPRWSRDQTHADRVGGQVPDRARRNAPETASLDRIQCDKEASCGVGGSYSKEVIVCRLSRLFRTVQLSVEFLERRHVPRDCLSRRRDFAHRCTGTARLTHFSFTKYLCGKYTFA